MVSKRQVSLSCRKVFQFWATLRRKMNAIDECSVSPPKSNFQTIVFMFMLLKWCKVCSISTGNKPFCTWKVRFSRRIKCKSVHYMWQRIIWSLSISTNIAWFPSSLYRAKICSLCTDTKGLSEMLITTFRCHLPTLDVNRRAQYFLFSFYTVMSINIW